MYARLGQLDQTHAILDVLLEKFKNSYVSPFWIAFLYHGLRDTDRVFEWLNKAYELRDDWMTRINTPYWDELRDDPRFRELLKRMRLKNSG